MALRFVANLNDEEDELESLKDLEEEEDLAFLSKKYKKILRLKRDGNRKKSPFAKKSSNKSDQQNPSIPTCFECKKLGHNKLNCLVYLGRMWENERKKKTKQLVKKAHLTTWGDEDIESGNEEEKEEETLLCLIALEDKNIEVCDSNLNTLNDNGVDDLYTKLYDDLIKAKKNVSLYKKIIVTLEIDIEAL